MLAQDMKPNRLTFAKQKIRRLVSFLKSERVGLLIFAGMAVVQCPLTTDYNAFFMFLDSLDAQTISSGTTALDEALKKSLTVFSQGKNQKTKLLVMFTDGEDFSSNLTGVKEQVVKEGVTIFTIGVGTAQGAPIPVIDEYGHQKEYEKDSRGGVIMSRLNEGILKVLARESGGQYLSATESDQDIRTIVSAVEQFEQEKFEDRTIIHWHERYMYFVALGLFLLVCEWLV
jgi:Ca-activated chloride channel family protein